ncbi:hypothetical protein [Actinacidiphila paucisporea]|uniref:hypothetical protein n=1 Tax=Actinacidiphila paucisporea TaxID=310782 RepID=UPI0009A0D907|nr:hypothetical protein [Actinacidiphila paucisporea]
MADVANGVALALDGEGDSYALSALLAQEDTVALAAVRVLGADVLAPYALRGDPARGSTDRQVVRRALAAYPPGADASDVSLWSYRGLVEASRAFLPETGADGVDGADGGGRDGEGGEPGAERPPEPRPGDAWVQTDPWPALAHRASQLAALSLPSLAPALAVGLAARTDDLARGFVRAVRRRDWLQAAGVGRWLVRAPDVPDSLGLAAGLVFVRRMSGSDPRVVLHTTAAQRFPGGGPW